MGWTEGLSEQQMAVQSTRPLVQEQTGWRIVCVSAGYVLARCTLWVLTRWERLRRQTAQHEHRRAATAVVRRRPRAHLDNCCNTIWDSCNLGKRRIQVEPL